MARNKMQRGSCQQARRMPQFYLLVFSSCVCVLAYLRKYITYLPFPPRLVSGCLPASLLLCNLRTYIIYTRVAALPLSARFAASPYLYIYSAGCLTYLRAERESERDRERECVCVPMCVCSAPPPVCCCRCLLLFRVGES